MMVVVFFFTIWKNPKIFSLSRSQGMEGMIMETYHVNYVDNQSQTLASWRFSPGMDMVLLRMTCPSTGSLGSDF